MSFSFQPTAFQPPVTALLVLLALLLSHAAHADLSNGAATVAPANIPAGQTSTVTVTWTMTLTPQTAGNNEVSSPRGFFEDVPGSIIATNNTALSQTINVAAGQVGTPIPVTFNETLVVPAAVIADLLSRGRRVLLYKRQFTDSPDDVEIDIFAFINIVIDDDTLQLNQLNIYFDQSQPVAPLGGLVAANEPLRATALLLYRGSGPISLIWEIARAPTLSLDAGFETLGIQQLQLRNNGPQRLLSPTLPTDGSGQRLLRLRILSPAAAAGQATLRYAVVAAAGHLSLQQPEACSGANSNTAFSWQTISTAERYQLQFFNTAKSLLVGMEVTAENSAASQKATLSAVSSLLLGGAQPLFWQVSAINSEGHLVSQSEQRQLNWLAAGATECQR